MTLFILVARKKLIILTHIIGGSLYDNDWLPEFILSTELIHYSQGLNFTYEQLKNSTDIFI
jgi:hypothetical protein